MKSAWILVCLIGCGGTMGGGGGGGDDDDDTGPNMVDPHLIATGGVANSPLGGQLHVYAVEANSSTPIANAAVTVGTLTGTTDATGLATFNDASLSGKATVTVTATGHAASTWIGVAGANVTIPLEVTPKSIPTAHASGSIQGWGNGNLSPALGNYMLAVVLYSFLDDPTAPENGITQPLRGDNTPMDSCIVYFGSSSNCSWQLTTRTGPQVHTAIIVEGDPQGTNSDTSDDTYTVRGFAYGQMMSLTAGQQVSNEVLQVMPANQALSVSFPAAPAGLGTTIAIPELQLDSGAGRVVFPLPPLKPGSTSSKVLAPTGAFAGHYELVALATPNATASMPYATSFVHDVSASATVPAWLGQPTAVTGGSTFSFTGTGAYVTAQISRQKQPLWDVTILDGSTSFTLPTLSPDPIGSGAADFAVNLTDAAGFQASAFDVATATKSLARVAGAQTSFTR